MLSRYVFSIVVFFSTPRSFRAVQVQQPGLRGEYFKFEPGVWLPDLTSRKPDVQRPEENLYFPRISEDEAFRGLDDRFRTDYAARFTGKLRISKEGKCAVRSSMSYISECH